MAGMSVHYSSLIDWRVTGFLASTKTYAKHSLSHALRFLIASLGAVMLFGCSDNSWSNVSRYTIDAGGARVTFVEQRRYAIIVSQASCRSVLSKDDGKTLLTLTDMSCDKTLDKVVLSDAGKSSFFTAPYVILDASDLWSDEKRALFQKYHAEYSRLLDSVFESAGKEGTDQ